MNLNGTQLSYIASVLGRYLALLVIINVTILLFGIAEFSYVAAK
jgi:hypothetical protein